MNNSKKWNWKRAMAMLLLGSLAVAGNIPAHATTRTVTSLGDVNNSSDGVLTLREAVSTATVGDTIKFSVTGEIKLLYGELGISRNLNIVGPKDTAGYNIVTINGDTRGRVFSVTGGNVSISNLTIAGGLVQGTDVPAGSYGAGGEAEGGGVYVGPYGTLTLSHCFIARTK